MNLQLCDVTLRDGFQSLEKFIATQDKFELYESLEKLGINHFEFTSFVSPKVVPQLSDAADFSSRLIAADKNIDYSTALILNYKGLLKASESGVVAHTLVASADESFSLVNTRQDFSQLDHFVTESTKFIASNNMKFRGSISMSFGTLGNAPDIDSVLRYTELFAKANAYEVSLADTVSNISLESLEKVVDAVKMRFPHIGINLHLHGSDLSLMPILELSLDMGIKSYDVSLLGLGGCPNVKGHFGNLSYLALLNACDKRNINFSISRDTLLQLEQKISEIIY